MILLCKINRKVSFLQTTIYQPYIAFLTTNYETLRLFFEKKLFMCAKERRKEAMMIQEKSSNGYYSIAAYFILLYNLEADTQRMRMLIPIGTKQYELANLGGRTDMLANTWTNIIITDTNQTQGLARIIRQTV